MAGKSNMSYYITNPTYANVTIVPNGGYTLASTATGTNWTSSYYTQQPKVQITEDDITIDGLSLKDSLRTINDRLGVLQVNPALEKEFDELKACADEYRRLEKKFLEQQKMWNTLKK
jgi:hypothetical protein